MNRRIPVRASATILAGVLAATSLLAVAPASASTPTKRIVTVTPAATGAHKVFAVLLAPSDNDVVYLSASQTAAKVATAVSSASTYWSKQSSGKVTFTLTGTSATWSESEFACDAEDSEVADFIDEATSIAEETLGYEAAYNTHLLIVTPTGTDCDLPDGSFASAGSSVNAGGWVITSGSDSAASKASLIKGLGSNLSFGSANATAVVDEETVIVPSGDTADALGTTEANKAAGSVSSAAAIRAGIWPTTAYSAAALGTSTHILKPIAGASGKRSVIVEGSDGVNYFVEYRTAVSGTSGSATAGVRVVRLENDYLADNDERLFKGAPGADTTVLGHDVEGVTKTTFTTGQQFNAPGVTITVGALTSKQVTVSVVRGANPIETGGVKAFPSVDLDGDPSTVQVGDIWTAYLTSDWEADSYKYQWYRGTGKIAGATKSSYTVTASDVAKSFSVVVSPVAKGQTSTAKVSSGVGIGPVTAGVQNTGTVTVTGAGTSLSANLVGWTTPGTKVSYQWYRGATAIAKATKSVYTPKTSDGNFTLQVKVKVTRSGFNTVTAESVAKNYSTNATGTLAISGDFYRVGYPLSVNELEYSTVDGVVASHNLSLKIQWYRGKSAISKANSSTYTPTSADFGQKLSVKVSGGVAGNINPTFTSAPTVAIARGVIAGTLAQPEIVPTSTGLTISYPEGSLTTPTLSYKYQWYRGITKISGATKSKYVLTSADTAQGIAVIVTVSKLNYTTVVLTSASKNYAVTTSGLPVAANNPVVGHAVTTTLPVYLVHGESYVPTGSNVTYQWYANGSKITGATASSYTPLAAHVGKTLTVTVTAKKVGYISSTLTSVATAAVVAAP